ncbi:Alpha/Beta hydrolase protein [Xylariomycetidae sp. FL0641]|nr:Alpha/Beta hydrolase protein [Xylariomycetidae sp. FL0641]
MANPGMLYVTMQPKPELPIEQFHEWYNNEHGPTRLRLPQIFTNGLRYRATDGEEPTFLAAYDVTDMSHLETETYTSLRANRSPREAKTIAQVDVTRYFWDLRLTRQSPQFVPVEQLTDEEAEGRVLVAVEITPKEGAGGGGGGAETEIQQWYEEEHADMLAQVPGWLRSRLFRTSRLERDAPATKLLALHEYARRHGLGGPEHRASMSTPRREQVFRDAVAQTSRRQHALFYVFGPAPRDLQNLSRLPAGCSFASPDAKTFTTTTPGPAIASYVAAPADGLAIPYRLEGNPDPKAPTIAFVNSLLTDLHMWDDLVDLLKVHRPRYRILRYDARGRHGVPRPPRPATLDALADDLRALLGALRIARLDALVGVSLGGATTLHFALRHPDLVERFVACDFNAAASAANTAAWRDRVAAAETPLPTGESGLAGRLAPATVARWFHPHTAAAKPARVEAMTRMVAENDLEGFRCGCQALWDYDLRPAMRGCRVPGLLVAGDGDGKGALVQAMDGFKGLLGEHGAELKVVPQTGHLPMFEAPEAFWKAVEGFL